MVRSLWKRSLVASLAWAGLAWPGLASAQQSTPKATSPASAEKQEQIVTVQENGRTATKCKVIKTWKTAKGETAYQVQALKTGEIMTIVESGPSKEVVGEQGRLREMASRIFHWSPNGVPPRGTPVPPPAQTAQSQPPPVTEITTPRPAPRVVAQPPTVQPAQSSPPPTLTDMPLTPLPNAGGQSPPVQSAQNSPSTVQPQPSSARSAKTPAPIEIDDPWDSKPVTPKPTSPAVQGSAPTGPKIPTDYAPATGGTGITAAPNADGGHYSKLQVTTSPGLTVDSSALSKPPSVSQRLVQLETPPAQPMPVSKPASVPAPGSFDDGMKGPGSPPPASSVPEWRRSWGTTDSVRSDNATSPPPRANVKQPDLVQTPESYAKDPLFDNKMVEKEKEKSDTEYDRYRVAQAQRTLPSNAELAAGTKPGTFVGRASASDQPTPIPSGFSSPSVPSGPGYTYGANGEKNAGMSYNAPIMTGEEFPHMAAPPAAQIPRAPQPVAPKPGYNAFNPGPTGTAFGPSFTTTDPTQLNAFNSHPSQEQIARVSNAFTNVDMETGGPVDGLPSPPPGAGQPGMSTRGQQMAQSRPTAMMNPMERQVMIRPGPQGYLPEGYQVPTMRAQPTNAPAVSQLSVDQHLANLKDSLYPSQREWAVQCISGLDWKSYPQVVRALLSAAQDDPAATVRASCVHCLAKLQVNTVPVVNALQSLKMDADPRVRHEVEQALNTLVPGQPGLGAPSVQPVGVTFPVKSN